MHFLICHVLVLPWTLSLLTRAELEAAICLRASKHSACGLPCALQM